jgi:hypothetical protein
MASRRKAQAASKAAKPSRPPVIRVVSVVSSRLVRAHTVKHGEQVYQRRTKRGRPRACWRCGQDIRAGERAWAPATAPTSNRMARVCDRCMDKAITAYLEQIGPPDSIARATAERLINLDGASEAARLQLEEAAEQIKELAGAIGGMIREVRARELEAMAAELGALPIGGHWIAEQLRARAERVRAGLV